MNMNNQARVDEVFPTGTGTDRAIMEGISNLLPASSPLRKDSRILWLGLCAQFVSGMFSKDAANITLPTKHSEKYEGRVSFMWLTTKFTEDSGVNHDNIFDAFSILVQIWDLMLGLDGAPSGSIGYYRMALYPILALFDQRASDNVYSMSPVYLAGVLHELTNELGTFAAVLLPPTSADLKARLALIVSKYSFGEILSKYEIWCRQHILDAQAWLRVVETDASFSSRVKRDNTTALSSSSSLGVTLGSAGGAAKIPKVSANKKPKAGVSKGNKAVTQTPVQPSPGPPGAPPALPPLPQGSSGKSCKFHLKHLFLGGPACTKGGNCTLHHQRTVKSVRKSDLLAFLAHKCSDDPDYLDLCQAVHQQA
jgi:hypothetical protein